jgi:polyhydroxybutyrate depolymerase
MRNTLHLLSAVALAATAPALSLDAQRGRGDGAAESGARSVALRFQGRLRHFLVYEPAAANGSLVLAFHGGGQTAAQMEQISGLNALAAREHFIVAYPEAFERSWADGRKVTSAEKQDVDDVGFAKAVVADIAKTHALDGSRVFATGLSNGGIFTYRLACEGAATVAAIAPVVATMATSLVPSCHPSAPVAVVGIQGVADPSVPFGGGYVGGRVAGGRVQSSRATQELWRSLNGCAPTVTSMALPVFVEDGTSVDRRSYASCRGNGDVVWYEIHGGGHRWPPSHQEDPEEELARRENGVSSKNINASEVVWAFFAAHARR